MKNLLKILIVLFGLTIMISCEKFEIKPDIQTPNYKSVLFDPLFDSLQYSFTPITEGGDPGYFYCVWNYQTGALDSIQNYIRIYEDTLKWIEWNKTQNELYESYDYTSGFEEVARPTSYRNYLITDVDVYMPWYPNYFDIHGTITYDADSSGIILFTGQFTFELTYTYTWCYGKLTFFPLFPLPGTLNQELVYENPTFLEELWSITPATLNELVETLPVEELTTELAVLNWNADENLSWRLFIEKDNELIINSLVLDTNTYNFYYSEPGIYKYYVEGFNGFGVTETSNETTFERPTSVLFDPIRKD